MSTQTIHEDATHIGNPATTDLKLEVVVIPVSDVDRAKRFYEGLGWTTRADPADDRTLGEWGRVVGASDRTLMRAFTAGAPTVTCRSNRPGRSNAGSNTSGRLVAAIRITPSLDSNPSISTSSWFNVCSRSSCPPELNPLPRRRPSRRTLRPSGP